jgi:hypothetical protein
MKARLALNMREHVHSQLLYYSYISRKLYEECMDKQMQNSNFELRDDKRAPMPSTLSSLYLEALRICFGNDIRKASLGHRHVDKSIYADQLRRWFANFNRSMFYIMDYRNFEETPREELAKVTSFFIDDHQARNRSLLALRRLPLNASRLVNPNHLRVDLPSDFKQNLLEYFQYYDQDLHKLIGWSFL